MKVLCRSFTSGACTKEKKKNVAGRQTVAYIFAGELVQLHIVKIKHTDMILINIHTTYYNQCVNLWQQIVGLIDCWILLTQTPLNNSDGVGNSP